MGWGPGEDGPLNSEAGTLDLELWVRECMELGPQTQA